MKILQVNKYHYPRGGADKYYLELGERLSAAGNEVAYFSMQHPKNLPTPWSKYFVSRVSYNERIWRYAWKIPGRTIYSLEAKKKFKRLIADFHPDIIHIHNIYHQISPSILSVAAKAKIPVVMHVHDYKLICPNHSLFTHGKVCTKCLQGSYWPCISQRCVKDSLPASVLAATEMYLHHNIWKIYERNISALITPSHFIKDLLIKAGWQEEKIKVINNSFSPQLPLPSKVETGDYFLYFGRLSREKGVDLAIQAINSNNNLLLKIAGTGPEENNLKELGKQAIKEGRLEFLGWQEGLALSLLIAQAKAILIPSRWLENFPLTALESISLGTPIIAADIGGLPEIVNSNNGMLIPAENQNALTRAMNDLQNKKYNWNKEKIKKEAGAYRPEINTEAVIKLYQRYQKNN